MTHKEGEVHKVTTITHENKEVESRKENKTNRVKTECI
jgi:hypothetical protein